MLTATQKIGFACVFLSGCLVCPATEPGTGIVVDRECQVWFTDSGTDVWRVGPTGELTMPYKSQARWLGFDANGRYAQAKPERYQRVTGKGVSPALLSSIGGPIAIRPEGDVYYAASNESGRSHPTSHADRRQGQGTKTAAREWNRRGAGRSDLHRR
jgi:hypothetical protein